MKSKVLPILTLAIISTTSLTAQIKKGDLLLGATAGYNSNRTNSYYKSSNTNISPRVALAIGENAVLGLHTRFDYVRSKSETSDLKTSSLTLGGGAFWRKYIPIKNQLGWYLEANGGVYFRRDVNKQSGLKSKYLATEYSVNAIPGLYYRALPKLIINADFGGLGYNYARTRTEGNPVGKTSGVYFTMLSSFTFGVDFIL